MGYCLASRGKEENEIDALYLLPEAQGRGIGQKFMEEALVWLGDEKKISLGVAIYNDRVIRFYKRFGFQESNEAPHPIPPLPSGKRMPIVKMEKLPR